MYLGTTAGAVLGMLLGNFLHHRVLTPTRATAIVLSLLSLSAITLVGQGELVRTVITAGAFAVAIALVYAAVALHGHVKRRAGASQTRHEQRAHAEKPASTARENSVCCGGCLHDKYYPLREHARMLSSDGCGGTRASDHDCGSLAAAANQAHDQVEARAAGLGQA